VYQRRELVHRMSEEYPLQVRSGWNPRGCVRLESGKMGEKGNWLDMGEGIFANLAEQAPQFWLDYKQYLDSRAKGDQATHMIVEHQAAPDAERDAAAQDARAKFNWPPPRATE
jgi:hypothetical protein